MGYFTHHTFHSDHEDAAKVKQALVAHRGPTPFSTDAWICCGDGCKWPNMVDDCWGVAHLYPEVMFAIRGEGDEPDDQWVRVYQGDVAVMVKPHLVDHLRGAQPSDMFEYAYRIAAIPRDEWRSTFLVPAGEVLP